MYEIWEKWQKEALAKEAEDIAADEKMKKEMEERGEKPDPRFEKYRYSRVSATDYQKFVFGGAHSFHPVAG
jgi:uridine kinase